MPAVETEEATTILRKSGQNSRQVNWFAEDNRGGVWHNKAPPIAT